MADGGVRQPLDGLDAANCSGCGRTHIVLRQTGKPPIRQNVTMFEVSKTPRPRHDGIRQAKFAAISRRRLS